MNRRDFLKGCVGASAIAAVPALAKEKPFSTDYVPVSYPLHEGVIDMTGGIDLGVEDLSRTVLVEIKGGEMKVIRHVP